MKKPSIPSTSSLAPQLSQVINPMKETIEIITGARGGPLGKLQPGASNADVVTAINLIIARLNATGS